MITRYAVCDLGCKAYTTAVSASNLKSVFKKSGIYPFDSSVISNVPLNPSEVFIGSDSSDAVSEEYIEVLCEGVERV